MIKKPKKGLLWLSNLITCILLIFSGPVLASPADEYEGDDNSFKTTTNKIETDGTKQKHSIHSISDEDWMKFDAKANGRYKIVVDDEDVGKDIDIALELHQREPVDSTETTRKERKNRGFEGEGETINFTPSSNGTYYVRVTHTGFFVDETEYTISIKETLPENQAPVASFIVNQDSGPAPLTVEVDASESDDADGTIKDYNWKTSPDSQSKSEQTPKTSFTFNNPDTSYTITLTVTDNDDVTGEPTTRDVTVTEAPKLVITGDGLEDDGENGKEISVIEGAASKRFTVKLSPAPTTDDNVTVTITRQPAGSEPNITLNPEKFSLNAANNYEQNITLTVAKDEDIANGSAVFTLTADGVDDVKITVNEEEPLQLVVVENPIREPITQTAIDAAMMNPISVSEGSQTQFTVQVLPKPTQDVPVRITPKEGVENDPDITLTPDSSSFTLTAPNYEKEFTLTAAEDAVFNNGIAVFTVIATVGEGVKKSVEITVTEKEPPQLDAQPELVVDATEVFVPEGGQAQFNVNLSEPAPQDVQVTITTENDPIDLSSDLSLTPTGLFNFLSGENTAQTVSLTALDNAATKKKPKTVLTLSAQNIGGSSKKVKVFVLPSLGTGTAFNLDPAIPSPTTTTTFSGGVSVNGSGFEKQADIKPGETFSIKGLIKVDPTDIGENADFLTAINYNFQQSVFSSDGSFKQSCYQENPQNGWYLFIFNETAFNDCGKDIGGLLGKAITETAFTGSVALSETKPLPILPPLQLPSNSKLTVFFGYRLTDGTIVHSSQPIIVDVTP